MNEKPFQTTLETSEFLRRTKKQKWHGCIRNRATLNQNRQC